MNGDRYQHISEQELLNRYYAERNKDLLGVLFQRYTLLLLGVCMKYLKNEDAAKDAVQQIFLKAITELEKYRVDYFKSWLYMIAKNHCLMQFRNKNRYQVELNEQLLTRSETDFIPEIREKEKLLEWMHEGLKDLNMEQQRCLTLFYLEKKSYRQITEETNFTILQVKSFIQNGKRNLKQMIRQKMQQIE